jgi:hypothetical protein
MNREMPFLYQYLLAIKLAMQAPNDFFIAGCHQKSDVEATKDSP